MAELDKETEREALWNDLDDLDDEDARQAVTDYLNHEGSLPEVDEAHLSEEIQSELRALDEKISTLRPSFGHGVSSDLERLRLETQRQAILNRESTRQMLNASTNAEFLTLTLIA